MREGRRCWGWGGRGDLDGRWCQEVVEGVAREEVELAEDEVAGGLDVVGAVGCASGDSCNEPATGGLQGEELGIEAVSRAG